MGSFVSIDHYLDLLRLYWRRFLPIVILIPLFVAVLSTAQLIVSPKYTSTVSVTMLPSERELEFSRGYSGGTRRNQANALSDTYKEYLKSWPVVKRAMTSVSGISEATPEKGAPDNLLGKALFYAKEVSRFISRIISYANSGPSAFSDPLAAQIKKYQRAISISSIEGTFILQIETKLSDPYLSADFANALAGAYVERATEQATEAASILEEQLAAEVRLREAMLQDLLDREFSLRKELGALSLEDKRTSLRNTLESERAILVEDRVEREQLEVRGTLFEQKRTMSRDRETLERLDEELDLINSRRQELDRRIIVRLEIIQNLTTELDTIAELEKPILDVERRRASLEREIEELRAPITSLEISGVGELSQVRIVSPARPASQPSSPKVLLNTAKGFIVSAMLAVFGLVFVDLVSRKILTTTELRRASGQEAVGFLSRGLAQAILRGDRGLSQIHRKELKSLSTSFERRLSVCGYFDDRSINVTGFGSKKLISEACVALTFALASTGAKVSCRLPNSLNIAKPDVSKIGGEVIYLDADEAVPSDSQMHFECIDPVSATFNVKRRSSPSKGLICVVKSGDVLEETIEQFQDEMIKSGVRMPLYVLVDPKGLSNS